MKPWCAEEVPDTIEESPDGEQNEQAVDHPWHFTKDVLSGEILRII